MVLPMEGNEGRFVMQDLLYFICENGFEHHEYMFFDGYDHEESWRRMWRGDVAYASAFSPMKRDRSVAPPGKSGIAPKCW